MLTASVGTRRCNILFMKILKTIALALLLTTTACAQKTETNSAKKPDYSNVDCSVRTDIINPDTLQGDQKRIFWHFVKLTHEEIKNLEPLKIKEEFTKLGIITDEREKFVSAVSFFITYYRGHKMACENLAYFDFLKPKPKN